MGTEVGFRNVPFAGVLEEVIRDRPDLTEYIDIESAKSGGAFITGSVAFEDPPDWNLTLFRNNDQHMSPCRSWGIPKARVADGSWHRLIDGMSTSTKPIHGAEGSLKPGSFIVRREHASVEIGAKDGARIIFDPIFRAHHMACAVSVPSPEPGLSAGFITHSHSDHFNLATLHLLAQDNTALYVPNTGRSTILGEDMLGALELCGIEANACNWKQIIQVGAHISVEVLPFFGEQPSVRVAPADSGIRNWGSCYRVNTDDFSTLILSDSGIDPDGNMFDAIRMSVAKNGPVDVVLGCLRYFYSPFEVAGLPAYYSVLPVDGLREDYELYRRGRLESTTLGIAGTAKACVEAGAKVFLPYAHGFTGYRRPITANPFGPAQGVDEIDACRTLQEEIRNVGGRTVVVNWYPGGRWSR